MSRHSDPIADAIRELIERSGAPKSQIADSVGMNRSHLSAYLHCRRRIRSDKVTLILRDRGVLDDVVRAIRDRC